MGKTKEILRCLACDSENLKQVLDLGEQPLANSYLESVEDVPPSSSLIINMCLNCSHCQLKEAVDPDLLYRNYKYVSGTTDTLKSHFKELVKYAISDMTGPLRVLDIGCNDGSLLKEFIPYAYVYGVDPAKNLKPLSEQNGVKDVRVTYWNSDTALSYQGDMDIICVLNCLAHNSNPYDFLKGCTRVLSPFGKLIIEFPYFKETVNRKDFGQFYAEHHSYFTAKSFMALIERLGMYIADVNYFKNIHGGTIRWTLKKGFNTHTEAARELVRWEAIFEDLPKMIEALSEEINATVKDLDSELVWAATHGKVVAYGASAKSSTLFNLPDFPYADVAYVVDDNPLKQGLFCPGSGLEIKPPESLLEEKEKLTILLTVHNFKTEVLKKLRDMGIKGKLLNYTPTVSIEEI